MAGHTRLYRRGAVYYHRASVPLDIRETYQKTEETFSLNTRDHSVALKLVRKAAVETDKKFETHRRSIQRASATPLAELTSEQIEYIASVYLSSLLGEDEEVRLEGFYEGNQKPLPVYTFEEYGELGDDLDEGNRHHAARGKVDPHFIDEAEEVLTWEGVDINLARTSPSKQRLARALQAVTIRAHEQIKKRNKGDIVETPATPSAAHTLPLLSQAVNEWINEKSTSAWTRKTKEEKIARLAQFQNVAGDKPLNKYSKEDARRFKAVLLSIPPNWTKYDRFKDLGMEEAANMARAENLAGLEENTVKKAINSVSAFWNWALVHYDDIERNPLKGINLRVKASARDERNPFSSTDLTKIFKAPMYTGCKSLTYWHEQGPLILKDSGLFWVPLIALFTGARMGEIVQLYCEDVRQEGGVYFFDINDNGADKHLKNSNSRRIIPIHSDLIRMGFLSFVENKVKAGLKRLFEDIEVGSDGHYSSRFSKHFTRFLTRCEVKRPKVSFHSFRHSFEDACRNSEIPKDVMDALQGHGQKGMAGRYGNGFDIEVLAKAMSRLSHKGLDLSHLYNNSEVPA